MRERRFGALVELTVGGVAAQPIAKAQHARYLLTASRENVQVDVGIRTLEHAMLVPLWLADDQFVAPPLQARHVSQTLPPACPAQHDIADTFRAPPVRRGGAQDF